MFVKVRSLQYRRYNRASRVSPSFLLSWREGADLECFRSDIPGSECISKSPNNTIGTPACIMQSEFDGE